MAIETTTKLEFYKAAGSLDPERIRIAVLRCTQNGHELSQILDQLLAVVTEQDKRIKELESNKPPRVIVIDDAKFRTAFDKSLAEALKESVVWRY
jgi:hypothetical protein